MLWLLNSVLVRCVVRRKRGGTIMSDDIDKIFWDSIVGEVYRERLRQDAKWGRDLDHDDPYWLTILTEEVGELAEAIIEKDKKGIHDEAIQVAAVIFKFLELRVPMRED